MDTSDSEGCFESADEEFFSDDEGDDTVEEVSVKEKDENVLLETVKREPTKSIPTSNSTPKDKHKKLEQTKPPRNNKSEFGIPPEVSVCWEPGVNKPYNASANPAEDSSPEVTVCWEPGVNESYSTNANPRPEFGIPPARTECWFPEINTRSRQNQSPPLTEQCREPGINYVENINPQTEHLSMEISGDLKNSNLVKDSGDLEKVDNNKECSKVVKIDNKKECSEFDDIVDGMGKVVISDKKNNNSGSRSRFVDNIDTSKLDDESCLVKKKDTTKTINLQRGDTDNLNLQEHAKKTSPDVTIPTFGNNVVKTTSENKAIQSTAENKTKVRVSFEDEDNTSKEKQCDNKLKDDNKTSADEPSQRGDLWNEDDGWGWKENEEETNQSSHDNSHKTHDLDDKKQLPQAKTHEEENMWGDDDDWEIETNDTGENKKEETVKKATETKEEDLWGGDEDWLDSNHSNRNELNRKDVDHSKRDVSGKKDITKALNNLTQSNNDSSWGGWGNWGISSVLSTAANITSSVSQGITTVLETGIGVPDPEELARLHKAEEQTLTQSEISTEPQTSSPFGLTNLVSGVTTITKLVETTSTKVISGGLDTLETIGKKTMEVLQETDPGLKRGRAFLKIDQDKPVLSQILREAKEIAEQESKTQTHYAKKANYEIIFDDHQGLVHLEALEMLSKQCEIKLESVMSKTSPSGLADLQETLDQVKELCELLDEDEDEGVNIEEVKEKIEVAIEDIKVPISYAKLMERWVEMERWLSGLDVEKSEENEIHQCAIETLAELTAISVEQYHKAGELLLIKEHRSTADEADSLVQLTTVLTALISSAATKFSEKLNARASHSGNKDSVNSLITNVFLESANSSRYLQDAFQLLIPVIQVGAV